VNPEWKGKWALVTGANTEIASSRLRDYLCSFALRG
jgi:hypothetical protein